LTSESHDKLANRLTQILFKLNLGEKLSPEALATEFGVTLRTVQRDLNERFSYLPLDKAEGRYSLDPAYLGKISLRDVENFASLAGLQGLFPSLSDDFLRDIFDSRIQSALLIKGQNYEDLGGKTQSFKQLEQAIVGHHPVTFQYHKTEGSKTYTDAEPYKLVNHGGVWYLAAKDGGRLKAFSFTKIDRLLVSDSTFAPDPEVSKTLADEDDIWLNPEKIEVVLTVSREAAGYFKRRKLIAGQVIEKELEDGGIIVSCKVAHQNQILPIVRYWLPSIRIISPEGLQGEMEKELSAYLTDS
jgi:predicted DNA-binding transcriptional regulator YafY